MVEGTYAWWGYLFVGVDEVTDMWGWRLMMGEVLVCRVKGNLLGVGVLLCRGGWGNL